MKSRLIGLGGGTGLVVAVALLMVASSLAYSTARQSPVIAALQSASLSSQSMRPPSLPVQPTSRDGPLIIPGNYVTLTCTDGKITVGGHTCSNQTVTFDLCDTSPSCQYAVLGSALPGYSFGNWTWSGSSLLTNINSFNATLTVYVGNPAFIYSSSLTLNLVHPAGNHVTLVCTHGTITVGGDQCSDQTVTYELCDTSPSCQFVARGSALSGYGFADWTVSGSSAITNASYFNATLTVYAANPALTYSSTLTLTVGTATSVSGVVYVNESAPASVATIQIAGWNLLNGHTINLGNGYSFPIAATNFKTNGANSYGFSQWATTAGVLGSPTTQSTTFHDLGTATLSLITSLGSINWGGYALSGAAITSVSGTIDLPSCIESCAGDPGYATYNVSFWVGIGGSYGGAGLWQAGIAFKLVSAPPPGTSVTTITPFFEAFSGACSSSTYGCSPRYAPVSFTVTPGDTVIVNLSTSGGLSSFSIKDTTDGHSFSGTDSFAPNTYTADWIGELQPGVDLFPFATATFTDLKVNGSDITLGLTPAVAVLASYGGYYVTPSYVTALDGSAGFYVTDSPTRGSAP